MKLLLTAVGLTTSLLSSIACRTPAQSVDFQAQRIGFRRSVVMGTDFEHVIYENQGGRASGPLHVYLEGDGLPWIGDSRISPDPTPRRPLALELMALDRRASAYIGRPCYHGLQKEGLCNPALWTQQRYSVPIVDSLAAVIDALTDRTADRGLVLIGYSGGGVLAMLLAERLPQTRAVVTIASNLDIDTWTALHGYTKLTGSLNPAHQAPLAAGVRQFHLAGGRDLGVPPELIEPVASHQPGSEFLLYAEFDHTCCWTGIWPEVLERVAEALD